MEINTSPKANPGKWLKKLGYTCTMEYNWVVKKDEEALYELILLISKILSLKCEVQSSIYSIVLFVSERKIWKFI